MENSGLVGFSLSRCVKDILNGTKKESDVKVIIARTKAANKMEWAKIVEKYRRSYWQSNPNEGERIFYRLLNAGKIKQPRLEGKSYQTIKHGNWG